MSGLEALKLSVPTCRILIIEVVLSLVFFTTYTHHLGMVAGVE